MTKKITDKQRLDWLQTCVPRRKDQGNYQFNMLWINDVRAFGGRVGCFGKYHDNVRQAIDAAIRAQQGGRR